MKYLLDSVIVIDHLNGQDAATAYLKERRDDAAISVITRAEVLAEYDKSDAKRTAAFLDQYPVLGIDRTAADMAAALRKEHGWKPPDAFQAALAKLHALKLVTRNTRDFPPARHPFVTVPYELPTPHLAG